MWRKAMLYLGLGPDDEYDDYDPATTTARTVRRPRDRQPGRRAVRRSARVLSRRAVRDRRGPADQRPRRGAPSPASRSSRPASTADAPAPTAGGAAHPGDPNAKPHVVVPDSFNEAQEVADKFKGGQPVIMNLQGADRDLSRRLIDFASGLCYGLGGQMERVGNQVYLLTPANVEVSAEERRRLQERGYSA